MSWDAVYGQDFAKQYFSAHWSSSRINGAYLLEGPAGVGKARLALEAAKALNCLESAGNACDRCASCRQIEKGIHPDVHRILPEGASAQIRIGAVRAVLGRIALRPYSGRFQVVVLEGAEAITDEAANSLLKSLEEPPGHTCFLLTTARVSNCLPTIVSRCQRVRCQRLPEEAIARILTEHQACEAGAASMVARLSKGSAAKALEIARRWEAHQSRASWMSGDQKLAWLKISEPESRQEVQELLDGMMVWLRDVAVTGVGGSQWIVSADQAGPLERQARHLHPERCCQGVLELSRLRESLDQFANPKLVAALAREKWMELTDR